MIELFILFFSISFGLAFGLTMGIRIGNLIADSYWYVIVDFPNKVIRFFRFIPTLIQNVWYWKFRQPKLVKAMQQTGDHNKRVWALAERLKNSDRGRT